jgi:DNA-binding MarR family transcriptional regulator
MAASGFADRTLPDGRVLRICARREATISDIGRELGITRQGASKIVASLRDRRYVTLRSSASDGREKIVRLAPRAVEFLAARRRASGRIERQLRAEVGSDAVGNLYVVLAALGGDEQCRLSDCLRGSSAALHL